MTPSEKTLKLTENIKSLLKELERSDDQIIQCINSGYGITRHLDYYTDAIVQLAWLNHLRKRAIHDVPDYNDWIAKEFYDKADKPVREQESIIQTLATIMMSRSSDDVYANYFQSRNPDDAFGDENTELGEFKIYIPAPEEQEVLGTNEGFVYVIRYGIRWWDREKGIIAYGWVDPRVARKIKETVKGSAA